MTTIKYALNKHGKPIYLQSGFYVMWKVKPILIRQIWRKLVSLRVDYMIVHRANVLGHIEQTLVSKTVLMDL